MQNSCKFSRDIRCLQFESSDGNVSGWKSLLLYVVATLIQQNNYGENYYSSNTYKIGGMSLYLQFPSWGSSLVYKLKSLVVSYMDIHCSEEAPWLSTCTFTASCLWLKLWAPISTHLRYVLGMSFNSEGKHPRCNLLSCHLLHIQYFLTWLHREVPVLEQASRMSYFITFCSQGSSLY